MIRRYNKADSDSHAAAEILLDMGEGVAVERSVRSFWMGRRPPLNPLCHSIWRVLVAQFPQQAYCVIFSPVNSVRDDNLSLKVRVFLLQETHKVLLSMLHIRMFCIEIQAAPIIKSGLGTNHRS